MARLVRRVADGRWRIAVHGNLHAADLRRLERACAPALDRSPAPLELDVHALDGMDEVARRFVQCLLRRGAALVGPTADEWQAVVDGNGDGKPPH